MEEITSEFDISKFMSSIMSSLSLIGLIFLLLALLHQCRQFNARKRALKASIPTVFDICFGKDNPDTSERFFLVERIDVIRLVSCLIIIVLDLIKVLVVDSDQEATNETNKSPLENLRIAQGFLSYLVLEILLLYEIKYAAYESRTSACFLIINLIDSFFMLNYQYRIIESNDNKIEQESSINFGFSVAICVFKFILYFSYSCINRNVENLEEIITLNFSDSSQLEPLLDSRDSSEGVDLESIDSLYPKFDIINVARTPEYRAGLFSRLTFTWLSNLVQTGYVRPLEEEDFFKILPEDESIEVSKQFSDAWDKVYSNYSNSNPNIDDDVEEDKVNFWLLVRALHSSGILRPFYEAAFFKIIYDTLNFVPPRMLNNIIKFMSDGDSQNNHEGLIYILILFLSAATQTMVLHVYFHRVYRAGIRVRSALLTTIYKKSLVLSISAREKQTVGQIVNLMSTDTSRLQSLFAYLHISWSAIYVICLSSLFLWFHIRWAVFVALGVVFCFMMPLSAYVANQIKSIQKDVMKVKDKRIKAITETIQSIKVLKLYGWEASFRKKVSDCRVNELSFLWKYFTWRTAGVSLWSGTPIIMTLSTFAAYTIFEGKSFDAATAFTALSLLNILRFPLAMLPNILNSVMEATVSMKRICKFLQASEIDERIHTGEQIDINTEVINVEHATFFWDDKKEKVALSDITLSVKRGELCIITGKVGSGKTALLNMIINDLVPGNSSKPEKNVNIKGSIAYASQVPWIQNATLKENILFGNPYDNDFYSAVIFACALKPDLEQLPHGDATEIGEKGINLSGGQKARIALARAVYSQKDILLLESCFEAVDEHVGAHIWEHCFKGILASEKYGKKTVLCVTHALKRLRDVDKIIVMDNGKISAQGTFAEVEKDGNAVFDELTTVLSEKQTTVVNVEGKGNEEIKSENDAEKESSKTESETKKLGSSIKKSEKNGDKTEGNDLTGKEERGVGQVSIAVYWDYMNSAGGIFVILFILSFYFGRTACDFGTTRWLAYWSSHAQRQLFMFVQMNFSPQVRDINAVQLYSGISNETDNLGYLNGKDSPFFYLGIYALFSFSSLFFIVSSILLLLSSGFRAARRTHEKVLYRVTRSPMAFFDTTPCGRILNRFSKDIYTLDEMLPYSFHSLLTTTFAVLGTVFSIAYVAPEFLVAVPFLLVLYRFIQKYYIASSRELKRWDSVLRSPIYSFFTETLEGASTIRAYGVQQLFKTKNHYQVDRSQRAYYLSVAANRWLAVRLEFIGTFLVIFAALFVVLKKGKIDSALSGLALTYAFGITQTLNWTVRMFSELETNIVSVERLNDYIQLENEAAERTKKDDVISWPAKGIIEFSGVKARYREGLPLVLKGLTFKISAGEKIGIVGRTGAGKSSLFLVLMRLIEVSEGSIYIDDIDIATLGLERLRQAISVIPQDPIMFSGTVRDNLDPLKLFSDDEMMTALKLCNLEEHFKQMLASEDKSDSDILAQFSALDLEIAESGSNLSFGQRQLLCIARALVRSCKILLLDEATSGIDLATDSLIQETIRSQFSSCTVLTVAHRIETILGGSRVMVMDAGQITEFDTPRALLEDPGSVFSSLVENMKKKADTSQ